MKPLLALMLCLTLIFSAGCVKQDVVDPIEIVYTGNLIGIAGPCKCPGNRAGGFARRLSTIKKYGGAVANRILVDAGSYSSMRQDVGLERTELVAAAFEKMGYHAISPGYKDLRYGLDFTLKLAKEYKLPFISANIVNRETKQRVFPGQRVVRVGATTMSAGVEVAFIGVVKGGAFRVVPEEYGILLEDPVDAIKRELKKVPESAVIIVLLTDADRQTVAGWLEEIGHNNINCVISSEGSTVGSRKKHLETVLYYDSGRQGKKYNRLLFEPNGRDRWNIAKLSVQLNSDVDSDRNMQEFLKEKAEKLGMSEEQSGLL